MEFARDRERDMQNEMKLREYDDLCAMRLFYL